MILAIDPGNEQSAWVLFDGDAPTQFAITDNASLRAMLLGGVFPVERIVVEMIASYGMPVGREVFETCVWIGRFIEASRAPYDLVYRRDVKLHLCGQTKAKDSNIRQALIDRFGPGKDKAIGTKKAPGPLYGVSADVWAALALAVTWADRLNNTEPHEYPSAN